MMDFSWIDLLINRVSVGLVLALGGLGVIAATIYLKDMPFERKKVVLIDFTHLFWQILVWLIFCAGKFFLHGHLEHISGVLAVILGTYVSIKVFRIWFSMFLFVLHPREGVPLLFINLWTLVFAIIIVLSVINLAFNINVTSMIATSALLSIVLGLALQETLGNIMAGVTISITPSFEIGDWVEIKGNPSILGQVEEIHWRAVVVKTLTNEIVTIPNKIIVGSSVANLSNRTSPVERMFTMKVSSSSDPSQVKQIIEYHLRAHPQVSPNGIRNAYLAETDERGMTFKIIYAPVDFASQLSISSQVTLSCLKDFAEKKITLATFRISETKEPT